MTADGRRFSDSQDGKHGQPWGELPAPLSEGVSDELPWPKISVVTPNYNYGHFLEDTICSVLCQAYPNLEYILIDGASTDNSVDIIKAYESWFSCWESKKDNGQADAINQGMAKATGDIMGWLNSDDMYLPGTLKKVQKIFASLKNDEPTIVFGNCVHMDIQSKKAFGSDVREMSNTLDLKLFDYVIQPSCFWNREVAELVGPLSESLDFGFDWDWFIRAEEAGVHFVPIDDFLSVYRIHEEHKTGSGGGRRWQELAKLYETYTSKQVAESYLKLKQGKLVRFVYILLDKMCVNKFINVHKMVHKLFFSGITWREFDNIRRM